MTVLYNVFLSKIQVKEVYFANVDEISFTRNSSFVLHLNLNILESLHVNCAKTAEQFCLNYLY